MKVLKYLSFAGLLMCLASCSEENSVTLKVEAELGGLADYIKLTDQVVVVNMSDEKNDDGVDCKVITSSLALEVTKSVASNYDMDFDVEVLDENHVNIGTLPGFKIEEDYDYDNGELSHFLNAGSVRAQMRASKKVVKLTPKDQEKWNKILKEGAYILIKPGYSGAKYAEYKAKSSNTEVLESSNGTITEDEDTADSSSASSQDWDAMLDSYEEYVDKCISIAKKMAEGDMTAMTEYPALMSKAQEFCDKMENAKGSMSASQLARYTKLTEKMLKAAQK